MRLCLGREVKQTLSRLLQFESVAQHSDAGSDALVKQNSWKLSQTSSIPNPNSDSNSKSEEKQEAKADKSEPKYTYGLIFKENFQFVIDAEGMLYIDFVL